MKSRKRIPVLDFMEFAFVYVVMVFINFFPVCISSWIARRIGEAAFLLLADRRKIALENLAVAFSDTKTNKEKQKIALESFRHFATCIMEYFRMPKFVKNCQRHIILKGVEHLDRAFALGKGAMLVMSHLGPWEYLVFLPYLKKYPTTVLGRAVRNPYFYKWVKSLRNLVELRHSDKTFGPREVLTELKENHLVAIAIDQWAGNEGLWVDFFGVPTSTTSLPARLARKTGAALIPSYCIRTACGEYTIFAHPAVSVEADSDKWVESMTKKLNAILEEQIRTFPAQWMWTHRRWKNRTLPGRK